MATSGASAHLSIFGGMTNHEPSWWNNGEETSETWYRNVSVRLAGIQVVKDIMYAGDEVIVLQFPCESEKENGQPRE